MSHKSLLNKAFNGHNPAPAVPPAARALHSSALGRGQETFRPVAIEIKGCFPNTKKEAFEVVRNTPTYLSDYGKEESCKLNEQNEFCRCLDQ